MDDKHHSSEQIVSRCREDLLTCHVGKKLAPLYIVAVAGPTCAGKTALARRLAYELRCSTLLLDDYYRDLSAMPAADRAMVNFDSPEALDHELLVQQVQALNRGEAIIRPRYDFATHSRQSQGESFSAHEFLIIEGLFALYWKELRELAGTKIFVDAADDVCLYRRQIRDVAERGRTLESVTWQFRQTVQPMATLHVRPTLKYADLVLHGEQSLSESVETVLKHVHRNCTTTMTSSVFQHTPSEPVSGSAGQHR